MSTHIKTNAGTTTGLHTAVAPRATLAMGAVGAIVGGAAAAARNIARVKNDEMTRQEAVKDSLKEAGATGAAVAASTAVVGMLGLTGPLSLIGVVGAAIGAKYVVDRALAGKSAALAPKIKTASKRPIKKAAKKTEAAKD
jgi:hypothetical protein